MGIFFGEEIKNLLEHDGAVSSIAFSPDGRYLATGSWDDTVIVWDSGSGESLSILKGHSDDIVMVAFSPDSSLIASASEDKTIRLWDAQSGKTLATLGHAKRSTCIAFSPDGERLLAGGKGTLMLWRLEDVIEGFQTEKE